MSEVRNTTIHNARETIRISLERLGSKIKFSEDIRETKNFMETEEVVFDDLSLGRLPSPSECIKVSGNELVLKMCGDSEWHPRNIVLTKDKLMVAHLGCPEIADQVPLVKAPSPPPPHHNARSRTHQKIGPKLATATHPRILRARPPRGAARGHLLRPSGAPRRRAPRDPRPGPQHRRGRLQLWPPVRLRLPRQRLPRRVARRPPRAGRRLPPPPLQGIARGALPGAPPSGV